MLLIFPRPVSKGVEQQQHLLRCSKQFPIVLLLLVVVGGGGGVRRRDPPVWLLQRGGVTIIIIINTFVVARGGGFQPCSSTRKRSLSHDDAYLLQPKSRRGELFVLLTNTQLSNSLPKA